MATTSTVLMGTQLIKEKLKDSALRIFTVPCLNDNYAWILQDTVTGDLAVVDTPSATPIYDKLTLLGVNTAKCNSVSILNTHHHKDHTGGNLKLKQLIPSLKVYGPWKEKIQGIDTPVSEGFEIPFGTTTVKVIDIPGHTCGHVGYVISDPPMVFVGDTLFGHGCGGLFEGSFQQMWKSLTKISNLPEDTLVFCGHEYTLRNVMFARSVFTDDPELEQVYQYVSGLTKQGMQTVPSSLSQELRTNPFLRCRIKEYQSMLGKTCALDAFQHLRTTKDHW